MRIVRTAIEIQRYAGTVKAVREQASAVYPDSEVEEWFDYGGTPGFWRLNVNITEAAAQYHTIREMEDLLGYTKRLSAHLEQISYMVRHSIGVGVTVECMAYKMPECGIPYCGTYWKPAQLGYSTGAELDAAANTGVFLAFPKITGTIPEVATKGWSAGQELQTTPAVDGYSITPAETGSGVTGDLPVTSTKGYTANMPLYSETRVEAYHYIKKGLFLNLTQEELPRHGKHKQAYKKVCKKEAARAPAGESIEQRPTEVNERQEFGHWEGDTVYSGKGKVKTTCALFTMTERKTRNEIIIGVPNRKSETIVKAVDALERKLGARKFRLIFKSITFDNGTEFAAADMLERSCINKTIPRTKVYFCHPYSSWERGSNEHVNGMIRRKHPKGTDFSKVSKEQLAATEKWINEYPRKIFGYKSSAIMFQQCLNELGIAM